MEMLKMCLNWRVLAGLAAVGAGIYIAAPDLVAAALPILLLAACPLSMLLMMWGMQHAHRQPPLQELDVALTREERIARLRMQQAALAEQLEVLERQETHPPENGKGQ